MQLPKHLAIIMDGNGRWAQKRGHNRVFGHVRGARVAKQVIEDCCKMGLENLTLFAFSNENWQRPKFEINALMRLLHKQLNQERQQLIHNNIKFHCVGDVSRLPKSVAQAVFDTIDATKECTGMNLVFALSYGGRQDLCRAVRQIAEDAVQGKISVDEIDEDIIERHLEASFLPDPDAILRTSGESRLSNFFLWQSAYSEFINCQKMWPEFTSNDLNDALKEYSLRQRRFGKTNEQVISTSY